MKKRIVILSVAAVAVGLIAYLLYPLTSSRFRIEFDEKMIAYKRDFLRGIREAEGGEERPNIVLILADDLGKTDLSRYGGRLIETPHIDSIGEEGVTFTEAYTTSPICSPSRAALLTGRYQQRFGYELQPHDRYPRNRLEYLVFRYLIDTGNMVPIDAAEFPRQEDIDKQGLPPSEIALQEILDAAGYRCGIIGKWHLGFEEPFIPNNRGFAYHYGFYEAFSLYAPVDAPNIVNRRLHEFSDDHMWGKGREGSCAVRRNHTVIEEDAYLTDRIADEAVDFITRNKDRPFFLYIPFSAPHQPFQVTQEYYDRCSRIEDPVKRIFYAMVTALDDGVGRVLSALEAQGLDENTLVVFASDNGALESTGASSNDPLKGGKFTNFEGGINISFMMKWPQKLQEGRFVHEPVSLMDVFSTVAAVCSLPLPEDRIIDGVDLLPYCGESAAAAGREAASGPDGGGAPHAALFWRAGYNRAVRMGEWKYIVNDRDGTAVLYNLAEDKEERINRITSDPAAAEPLKKALDEWERGLKDPAWPPVMHYRIEIDGTEYYFCI